MDWQKITDAVTTAATLDGDARDLYLSELNTQTPETYEAVRNFVQQKSALDAFMMTAVGDYLPTQEPIYKSGDVVGLWKVESLLGSGGMGDVYKAVRADSLYDQTIALKVMKGTSETRRMRFDAERKRLAVLNHPGIAMILDGGQSEDGYPYLAMQYIDGVPIKAYCDTHTLKERQILALFIHVCEAVSSAHNNLILHRDIKSDNILVTDKGRVKLVDFGIATLLGEDDEEGIMPFSLGNAAPEQLNGETVSVQTDIFALGVLLHHLLTDRLPTRQPDGSVESKARNLDPELGAIIQKTLQTDPSSRYESVSGLAQDVQAFLTYENVKAYPGSPAHRLRKLVRRAPLASALTIGLGISLLAGMGVSQHFARTAQAETERANEELIKANWMRDKSNLDVQMSDAYADGFRYAFGQDKEDRLSGYLLEHHAMVIERYKDANPDYAALTSFVIGEHFIRRNDYLNGRAILEPWVTEEYGSSKHLLAFGQAMLGHGYKGLGDVEGAAKLFSKSASFYPGTPDENSLDHLAPATLAGIISSDQALQDEAAELIDNILKTTDIEYTKLFFLARLNNLEMKRGNWEAAHEALIKATAIIDSNRGGNIRAEDIIRERLSASYAFYKRDFTAARTQIQKLKANSARQKGENFTLGGAMLIQSSIGWAEQNFEKALVDLSEAKRLITRYNGEAEGTEFLLAHSGFLQVNLENYSSAQASLAKLESFENETSALWAPILKLYLIANRDGLDAAQSLADQMSWAPDRASITPRYQFYLDAVLTQGLVL